MYNAYKITNTINNKIYVGITKRNIEERFNEHISSAIKRNPTYNPSKSNFYYEIIKYGKNVFKVELIESNIPENKKCEKEIYYIKMFNSFYYTNKEFGYNMTIGGKGTIGYLFTNDDKKK